jgi:hypothetical protein
MSTTITHAISVRQPWAWLIVQGWKDVENRTWRTSYRGPIAIHASKTADPGEVAEFLRQLRETDPGATADCLQYGGLVGVAAITSCVTRCDSEWFTGPIGWLIRDARPIPFVPLVGRPGIFEIDPIEA